MNGTIETWFLVMSLFLPRITLLIAWLSHGIPPNTVPFVAEVFMTIFIPRVLILIYIGTVMGLCPWFYIHLITACLVWGKCSVSCKNDRG